MEYNIKFNSFKINYTLKNILKLNEIKKQHIK